MISNNVTKGRSINHSELIMGIAKYNSISGLIKVFENPSKEDFDDIAISIMQNFSIRKVEADSYGIRNVHYDIIELEFYLYNKTTNDVPTYNRDCLAGQWFLHRSGVDIAFETKHDGNELIQFGGILIRGLKKYVDEVPVAYIGGSQHCCFELFNNCKTYPELLSDENKTDISIYKSKRVRISFDEGKDTEFRYFVPILSSDWEKPRIAVFEKKIGSEYFVLKDKKSIKYADSVTIDENGVVEGTLVYPR